ncbi:MAG: DinB family protein [Candidatus Lambdaproteobacteria bacterium]|nr:DinB family protein [Candidatus Lambdaproteobacteria bacterium]
MKRLLLEQAEANRHINEHWLAVLETLPVEELERPRGAFFHSIFGTLNHILLGDRVWLARIGMEPFKFNTLSDRITESMGEFRPARAHTDDVLIAYVSREHDFMKDIVYRNSAGSLFRQPLYQVLAHVYAHQHHHRGQISQMCHEQKIEIPDGGLIGFYRDLVA